MMLIVFEGLDQSGKETQAKALRARLEQDGYRVQFLSFPDYETPIGREIRQALDGAREFAPDVMQLLYVANRLECRETLQAWLTAGDIVICDRFRASSVAYGEAQGLDPDWLDRIQQYLPEPDLTLLLDISPDTAVLRKSTGRDRFERDLALLARVRRSYHRQAAEPGWVTINAEASKDQVASAVAAAVAPRLAPRSTPGPR
jgi:dTMP kinase